MSATVRSITVAVLILAGLALWWFAGRHSYGTPWQLDVEAVIAALVLLPKVHRPAFALLERLRHPSPAARRWTTIGVAILAAAYFGAAALLQGRDLALNLHDEHSYMIQIQMLAHGRLWMPALPLGDFFETFYIMVRPKYASMYFPGAALMYVPTVWLHLPVWVGPVLAAGAVAGLCYRVIAELIDGVCGLLAALLVPAIEAVRYMSVMVMSHVPLILLGLLAVWAYLHWRRDRKIRWALVIGIFTGWAALTRPMDALCYAIPIGAAMMADILGNAGPGTARLFGPPDGAGPSSARSLLSTSAALLLGAAPFLLVQLLCNLNMTGHPFVFPYAVVQNHDFPGCAFGYHNPAPASLSSLPQKNAYYLTNVVPEIVRHQSDSIWTLWHTRLSRLRDATLPNRLLLVLIPPSLLGLWQRRRWVLWGMLPVSIFFYTFHAFYTIHYAMICLPAAILVVLVGLDTVATAWPGARTLLGAMLPSLVAGLALTSLPEINHQIAPYGFSGPLLRNIDSALAGIKGPRAVVLFRYDPHRNVHEEPVYNTSVAWPDDAAIIRANDLGPRNIEIFRYYAQRQPDRVFYLYDEATRKLQFLGSAVALAAEQPATLP